MKNIDVLHNYFGHSSFLDIQEEVIDNLIINKRNTLCLMPTGGGKSIIYQVAGLQSGKVTIIISPLIALMKQQKKYLDDKKLIAIHYNSCIGDLKAQYNFLKKTFKSEKMPHFFFVSPEKIFSDGYLEFIIKQNVSKIGLVVIDEVHCISQWGHTFRPTYKTIPYFLKNVFGEVNRPPILCLTATLNPKDEQEILKDLKIEKKDVFRSKFLLRDNLNLNIENQAEDNTEKKEQLVEILNKHKNEKVIVYTHIKAREYGTREMAKTFNELGFNCNFFDADLKETEKLPVIDQFISGAINIIFATSAFGMGIDIKDIRAVVHFLIPESIEQYYQEIGRAGRDNKVANGYLLHSETNFKVRRDLIKSSLITKKRIEDIFRNAIAESDDLSLFDSNRIHHLSRMDISEDNSELIVFVMLLEFEAIEMLGKGILFTECFENITNNDTFNNYDQITSRKIVTLIAKRLLISPQQVIHNLYKMFDENQIELKRSPINVLYYKLTKQLDSELAQKIHLALKEKVENRLLGLEKLSKLINGNFDPNTVIKQHLL